MDPDAFRAASRERWETAAAGWGARRGVFQRAAAPVSRRMVDAIDPQPGHVVLELAAGPGDTGFLAAARIRPGGRLISTDGAEAMVAVARARAAELGIADDVEVRTMEAEWIDLPAASVDGVLCRWGYMLLADPGAALRETRRVLRPGGRVALAAWAGPEHNPWAATAAAVLAERGHVAPADEPTMFSFAAPGHVEELLAAAGFAEVEVEAVDLEFAAPSFDDWWEAQHDLSPTLSRALAGASPADRDALHDEVQRRLAPHVSPDGAVSLPGRALVAVAEA